MEKIPVAESYERGEVAEREEGWRSQTPEMAKHPAVRLSPLLNVEVAEEERLMEPPVIVRPEADAKPPLDATLIPPANVEVAVEDALIIPCMLAVPVATKFATLRFPEINPLPWTARATDGVEVPMPTKVVEETVKREFLEESNISK